MSLIQKKTFLLIISFLLSFSSFSQSKKPVQVAVNVHYLFSFVFTEEFDLQGGNYYEHNHRVGLELELGKNFALGYDRFFINSMNNYLGNKNWTANIYMAKYLIHAIALHMQPCHQLICVHKLSYFYQNLSCTLFQKFLGKYL